MNLFIGGMATYEQSAGDHLCLVVILPASVGILKLQDILKWMDNISCILKLYRYYEIIRYREGL